MSPPAMGAVADPGGRRGATLFLLLELLVVGVSADCVRPVTTVDMVLTDETLLISSFREGASVTLACYDGYSQTGGTGLITCSGGKWTETDLVCSRMDCGVPPKQAHVIYDLSNGTKLGAIIKASCEEGYQISGSNHRQCFASGWLGRPKCKVKDCRTPAALANMTVSVPNGTLYGAEVEVSCDTGYKLVGSRNRRCETRGWSGDPKCEPVTCEPVRALANGRSSWHSELDSPTVGQTISFACDEGRILAGASAIVCLESGAYDNQPPVCLGVTTEGRLEGSSMTGMSSTSIAPSPGDRTTASTRGSTLTGAGNSTTPIPEVVSRNAFISRQGHVAIIAALASVAFVVCIVCFATRNVFSKKRGSSEVPRLISEVSGTQEECASQL